MNTVKGSMLEGFYPAGWDMAKIDACCSHKPEEEVCCSYTSASYISASSLYPKNFVPEIKKTCNASSDIWAAICPN